MIIWDNINDILDRFRWSLGGNREGIIPFIPDALNEEEALLLTPENEELYRLLYNEFLSGKKYGVHIVRSNYIEDYLFDLFVENCGIPDSVIFYLDRDIIVRDMMHDWVCVTFEGETWWYDATTI
ncbi:MAG: hypothetical protein JXK16_04495 [Thiotrichales bacterium]|nr:hypothetical protein [Thiotrichales bacterium]